MSEELMTVRQVAKQLRVGDKTVRLWIKAGELVVINLGDQKHAKHRISNSDLQAFLNSRRILTQSPAPTNQSRKKSKTTARWL
jgi:excisionase family DNA binding protein